MEEPIYSSYASLLIFLGISILDFSIMPRFHCRYGLSTTSQIWASLVVRY